MGKNNLVLGTARGKLGDIVFYRAGGEQRFRTRVRPTNPRTYAQLVQRCVVSTAVKFYSEIVTVADHAFQNYEGSLKNHQRYMKLNIDALRKIALQNVISWSPINWNTINYGNYTWKDSQDIAINPYIVSEGDITPIEYEFKQGATGGIIPAVGTPVDNTEGYKNLTYNEAANYLGVNVGDQITFIVCTNDENTGYVKRTHIGRIILMPSNGDTKEQLFGSSGINLPNKENYGDVTLSMYALQGEDNKTTMVVDPVNGSYKYADVIGYAVIVSRFENNRWRRSTQQIVVRDGFENQAALKFAVLSYLKNTDSSLYLNQSESSTQRELVYARENTLIEEEKEKIEVKQTKRTKKLEE